MEIANNLVTTLSTVDSPNQLSENNPKANVKKKGADEETSFDGALLATLTATPKTPVQGQNAGNADLVNNLSQQASAKVELSTKNAAKAENGGAPAPTIASLFQAKAEKDASGKMTGGFIAGPDQPWNSRWVLGAEAMPPVNEKNALPNPGEKPSFNLDQLKKLVQEQAQAKGGDESHLKQAAESTLQGLDSAIQALGGQLESVKADVNGSQNQGKLNVLGGAEYLAALQGTKPGAAEGSNLSGQQFGQGSDQQSGSAAQDAFADTLSGNSIEGLKSSVGGASMKPSKLVGNGVPNLKVLPGGLSSERLEGGMKLAKDEPTVAGTDSFIGAVPLTTMIRHPENNGAVPPQMITGHVVPGSMMKERLTSESIRNVTAGITGMAPNGGGEMRIKMNPGNLGELTIHVSTNGKNVGLKVQATDDGAKKVIEESLGALRDSLAQQSLALGRVDVTLAPTNAASADLGSNSQGSPNQNPNNAFNMQSNLQDGSRNRSGFEDGSSQSSRSSDDRVSGRSVSAQRMAAMNAVAAGSRPSMAASSSRLDVMA